MSARPEPHWLAVLRTVPPADAVAIIFIVAAFTICAIGASLIFEG